HLLPCSSAPLTPPRPASPLFPYTTLFRSLEPLVHQLLAAAVVEPAEVVEDVHAEGPARPAGEEHRGRMLADEIARPGVGAVDDRSEEHTSELQSLRHLVCRLLLEKKKQ